MLGEAVPVLGPGRAPRTPDCSTRSSVGTSSHGTSRAVLSPGAFQSTCVGNERVEGTSAGPGSASLASYSRRIMRSLLAQLDPQPDRVIPQHHALSGPSSCGRRRRVKQRSGRMATGAGVQQEALVEPPVPRPGARCPLMWLSRTWTLADAWREARQLLVRRLGREDAGLVRRRACSSPMANRLAKSGWNFMNPAHASSNRM